MGSLANCNVGWQRNGKPALFGKVHQHRKLSFRFSTLATAPTEKWIRSTRGSDTTVGRMFPLLCLLGLEHRHCESISYAVSTSSTSAPSASLDQARYFFSLRQRLSCIK